MTEKNLNNLIAMGFHIPRSKKEHLEDLIFSMLAMRKNISDLKVLIDDGPEARYLTKKVDLRNIVKEIMNES